MFCLNIFFLIDSTLKKNYSLTIKHLLHLSFILGKGFGVHTVQREIGPKVYSSKEKNGYG